MAKQVPIKYRSEAAVKKALKIDSFRNLSKDKIMQFASMIPYMDKEVALAVINQFPTFADFGKTAISAYMQACDGLLAKNNESQQAVIKGYQTILDALAKRIEKEDISADERKSITEDMVAVADKIAIADLQNKKFLEKIGTKVFWGITIVVAAVAAGIGINATLNGGDDLPELADNDQNDYMA